MKMPSLTQFESMTKPVRLAILVILVVESGRCPAAEEDWQPAKGPLMTRWAKDVSPRNAHPEYPRPQMTRSEWRNLNGLWDYAIRPKDQGTPAACDGFRERQGSRYPSWRLRWVQLRPHPRAEAFRSTGNCRFRLGPH